MATIFQVPCFRISFPFQVVLKPPDVAAAKNVPVPSFVRLPEPEKPPFVAL